MHEFSDRSAIVTGGGNGIGRATALLFAERGAQVCVSDFDEKAGGATVAEINGQGGSAIFVGGDIADPEAVAAMIDQAAAAFGKIDCAFNNAGITHPRDSEWDDDAFERTLAVNLHGVMQCMKAELRHMAARGRGAIVNASSIGGMVASANPSLPGYTASKHAVLGITKVAALKYGREGIRVNAVLPGVTATNMVAEVMAQSAETRAAIEGFSPMGRVAQPREIAEAVLFLCSDRASYINGHGLAVDGGILAQ